MQILAVDMTALGMGVLMHFDVRRLAPPLSALCEARTKAAL